MVLTTTEELLYQIQAVGLPPPVLELAFCEGRRWRFDLAWPDKRIALEIEGGIYSKGRHIRPDGYLKDLEKYNRATALGWRVFRTTPQLIGKGEALALLEKVLK